jgi:hypothetical protein
MAAFWAKTHIAHLMKDASVYRFQSHHEHREERVNKLLSMHIPEMILTFLKRHRYQRSCREIHLASGPATFADFLGAAAFFVAMAGILPSEGTKSWYLHAV